MLKWKFSIRKQWKIIYLSSKETMERNLMEECKWLNVQNVEPKLQSLRSHGKWQVAQTNKEKECNWKSGSMNAQTVTASEKY